MEYNVEKLLEGEGNEHNREKIKRIRMYRGLTQEALGKALSVSTVTIGQWERGTRKLKIDTIAKIAKALDVDIIDLINDDYTTKYSKNKKMIISNNENIKHLTESKTKEQNLLLCAEEAGEWIQAVSKMARGTPEERRYTRRRDKLIGETADLIICIGIIRQMYGIDDDELQEMIDYKMQRNLERIEGQHRG